MSGGGFRPLQAGRGPDPFALALERHRHALQELRDVEERLPRLHEELRDSGRALDELGSPQRPRSSRALTAAIQVLDGVPFWDREANP